MDDPGGQQEQGQAQAPQRHMCHCGKGFLRKEHLRRHQATHGERAHVCPVCSRSFTRNDLLRRHLNLHENAAQPPLSRSEKACDSCHENKTKCDGGDQCSLCAKRGVPCTYDRMATQEVEDESSQQEQDDQVSEASSSQAQSLPAGPFSIPEGPIFPGIPPTPNPPPPQFDEDVLAARNGLRSIVKAVAAFRANKSVPTTETTEAGQRWLSGCLQTSFSRFHERWPFVHVCTFDEKTDHAMVVSSVVITGSWFNDPDVVRKTTVDIHQFVVNQLMAILLEPPKRFGESEPWPTQIWRSALLQIVLAFEIGREDLMSRARRLLCLLITSMRDSGALLPLADESHQKTHYPGNFPPWVHARAESVKRLASCVFRVDVYYAILFGQSPYLQPEELELSLPTSFSVLNSFGIPIFFARNAQEPADRTQCTMADMIFSPQPLRSSGFLVEDIQFSLCGVFQGLWRTSQIRRRNEIAAISVQESELLAQRLETLKLRLFGIDSLRREPGVENLELTKLLKSYRSEIDDESDPAWRDDSLARLSFLVFNTTMLYHLLSLQLYADTRTLNLVTGGVWGLKRPLTMPIPKDRDTGNQVYQWALSQKGRIAVLEAVAALAAYESFLINLPSQPGQTMDPVAHVSLSHAAMVVQAWITYRSELCTCQHSAPQLMTAVSTLSLVRSSEQEQWIINGGNIAMDGVLLCKCSLGAWLDRFMSVILQGCGRWELSGVIAGNLQAQRSSTSSG